ncbi:dipeptidyl peptidase 2-like [Wyeomyia smithii]|uniref:dipeptidyl peptidase 2-like n=1 Tax=Wyeomyia smithii TaxID=174621 RepID=UPI002467E3D7|nr:dipeptidyl peptidase 2-like [Wyeomyia smithii]
MIDLGRADMMHEKFNICTPIDPENTRQVQFFFSVLMATVEMVIIYTRDVAGFAQVCQDITGTDAETAVDAFANSVKRSIKKAPSSVFSSQQTPFQPFGDRVTLEVFGREVFGEWITEESIQRGIDRANNRFGGDNPGSSLTYFTNGDADPWRMISITRNLTLDAQADVIRNQLGGSDLPAMSPDDPADLLEVKQRLKLKLASYLFPFSLLDSSSDDRL